MVKPKREVGGRDDFTCTEFGGERVRYVEGLEDPLDF